MVLVFAKCHPGGFLGRSGYLVTILYQQSQASMLLGTDMLMWELTCCIFSYHDSLLGILKRIYLFYRASLKAKTISVLRLDI